MNESRKHQVSLRGASAKEISRDVLLEKISQERALRNFTRRATASARLIQRAWQRYNVKKCIALELQQQWESLINSHLAPLKNSSISSQVLRPFLFFTTFLLARSSRIQPREKDCIRSCFGVILESINSTNPDENFCSMATGTMEERKVWNYQAKKLVTMCLFILQEYDNSCHKSNDVLLASLAMRLAVILTDVKGWKCISDTNIQVALLAVRDLVQFLGSIKSGLYNSVRRYICKLEAPSSAQATLSSQTDEQLLITASAITLALRPFHVANLVADNKNVLLEVQSAAEQYCIYLLTIPWFGQRLPVVLIPPLKHKSVLTPCLRILLMSKEQILKDMSDMDQMTSFSHNRVMPPVGWALGNFIYLATGSESNTLDSGKLVSGIDRQSYVRVVITLAEKLLTQIERAGWVKKENQEVQGDGNSVVAEKTFGSLQMSYMDLFKPVCLQKHLMELLVLEQDGLIQRAESLPSCGAESSGSCELLDVAYYYSWMLRIFSSLNPLLGAMPVLNMLSFTPGFLSNLWGTLEESLFPGKNLVGKGKYVEESKISENKILEVSERKQKHSSKDIGSKWASVFQKITGKSQTEFKSLDRLDGKSNTVHIDEHYSDMWDIELLRQGPDGISKDLACLLHLFCASYSHLLLVLDDQEFYEKQVPFTLEQQQKIVSVLNTLVYNTMAHSIGPESRPLTDSAIKCLHLLYERDCRHQFCPPTLWLSPGRNNRPPIAVAARTHEVLSATSNGDDALTSLSMGSIITVIPHIFPFEERVEMFREFINMDKVSRKMAGEVVGPGPRNVEIVIRRGHIVEDGFQQLNNLGSRLKSSIHVSFVNESGLPEAGLDYGGLSKEFLTEIAKAAFSPEYGLFTQTLTSDRHLIPNTAARFLDNGFQMIEFLGRIVGKALYEGILLDYSFSHVFVQKLLGRYSFLDELSTLDPELYRNLMYVKHYDGDVKDLALDFTVTEESLGKHIVIELKPGGKDTSVTKENMLQYVHAMADFKLNRQILAFSNAFYRGLTDLISPSWLKLFNASEFNQLLSGGNHDIDIDDLRKNTRYTGGYTEGSRTVKLFWEAFANFEPKERCLLLKFVTSCSRAPLLGFKHLQPTFTIHKVSCDLPLFSTFGGQDVDRLPSASTCYNTLKLPTYKRQSTLRAKLLYAINSNAGFELS
ncbi:E3 ubiquitin-protein ligase UPL7-like [Lycium barbarum]|uniref:E3 ubiquitin-protein ligase UPL7-like n=1 Tax=Lycium barbarum TaxID=112863 RepID=UPI00293E7237|nr:E3 ubiquitin-protein ligase UPL7-like [Lycium barbarum]XP_060201351.1 E3 ubiquitin-protein ligase UPL7-like [Lycium barbarum]